MNTLIRYAIGGLIASFVLIALFESINPKSWPRSAVGFELAGCFIVFAAIMGRQEAKEKKQEEQRETDKHFAELRSKERVELEKHRMTLEAQQKTDGASNMHNTGISPMLLSEQAK
ncbi:MAG TPA: hypothetical protein VHC22_19370 [Pirellulales bacterium]|nr:hypothetical protein [Pirellulales bacterium]